MQKKHTVNLAGAHSHKSLLTFILIVSFIAILLLRISTSRSSFVSSAAASLRSDLNVGGGGEGGGGGAGRSHSSISTASVALSEVVLS